MNNNGLLLNDELWERLLELTEGDVALCYQCGECTAACPWGLVREKGLPVRLILRQAQLGVKHTEADLWLCTTCGQCQATCPRGVDIPRVFKALRQLAWEHNNVERDCHPCCGHCTGTTIPGLSRHPNARCGRVIFSWKPLIPPVTRCCSMLGAHHPITGAPEDRPCVGDLAA